MDYLQILGLSIMILFCVSYKYNNGDLLRPSTGTYFFCLISIFLAILGNNKWRNHFYPHTYWIVIAVLLWIGILDYITQKIVGLIRSYHIIKVKNKYFDISRLEYPVINVQLVVFLCVFFTIGYALNIFFLGSTGVTRGIAGFIYKVRNSERLVINPFFKQGVKFVMAASYVNGLAFINNFLSKKIKRTDWIYIIPSICGMVCSIFTGVRTEIYRVLLSLFVYMLVFYSEKNEWSKNISIGNLTKKVIFPVILFLLLFYFSRFSIKSAHLAENERYGLFSYVFYYMGSPWLALNNKICRGISRFRGGVWGNLTFSTFWNTLKNLDIISERIVKTSAFVVIDYKAKVYGNADTIIGAPLIDFNVLGMFVLLTIVYLFLGMFYYLKVKNTYSSVTRNYNIIIYSFFYYIIGLSFYANVLSLMVSVYYLVTLILIGMIYFFYTKIAIKL